MRPNVTLDMALTGFQQAAREYGHVSETHRSEDPAPIDDAAIKAAGYTRAILECGDEGLSALKQLMDEGSLTEQLWAAISLLEVYPAESVAALERVRSIAPAGLIKATAFHHLFMWRRRQSE